MALRLTKDTVTVFTNGEIATPDGEDHKLHAIASARGAKFNHRSIQSVSETSDGERIQLSFRDGSHKPVRMLLSTPPSVNRAADLISSLELETLPGPGGHVVTKTPMGESSLSGCFVAGDTSTIAKIVHVAMASGKCLSQWLSGVAHPRILVANGIIMG